ncbi:hypothetical protein [Parapedobacter sp. DT-150]|uniref:hypothetical protein n=1 Tax=Parapedobacter sp. DT-150 TaxID=3396162 RepID=UPI003F1E383F
MIVISRLLTSLFGFGFAQGVLVFPFIFLKSKRLRADVYLINHERIHFRQAVELLVVGFYLLYLFEFLLRLIQYRQLDRAYRGISFEREAYIHDKDLQYLRYRRPWSFRHYFRFRIN